MTTIPSGLGGTLGVSTETTPGTFVAPSEFFYFTKEAMEKKNINVVSDTLGSGRTHLNTRRVITGVDVTGSIDLDLTDTGVGVLFKHALGATPVTTEVTTGVYQHVFALGDPTGSALSVQVGRPSVDGNIHCFSYVGCKVSDWTLGVAEGQVAKLSLTVDGVDEVTESYTAPSYSADTNPFHFAQGQLSFGGTTYSGGTYAGAVKSIEIKGNNGLAVNRRTLGSLTKKEQIPETYIAYTGTFEVEFADMALYTQFANGTSAAVEFTLIGGDIGGGNQAVVDVTIPSVFIDTTDGPYVQGPGILTQKIAFTVFSDGTDAPITVTTITTDATV